MTHSISEINREFRIKVYGVRDGKKYNTLVGVSGLIKLVGLDFAEKFINRAFRDFYELCKNILKVVCKLRTGLSITFYQR